MIYFNNCIIIKCLTKIVRISLFKEEKIQSRIRLKT